MVTIGACVMAGLSAPDTPRSPRALEAWTREG
jgi:hypothetical protein